VHLKPHILVEGVLVGMLSAHAWSLHARLPISAEMRERSAIEANRRLRFQDGRGVDINGVRVEGVREPGTRRVVGFLLRAASLEEDLRFWSEVARVLPRTSGVRLVSYCDGPDCVARARRVRPDAFPVIAYGEVVDSQAVLNADAGGSFVISNSEVAAAWRNGALKPEDIARRVQP